MGYMRKSGEKARNSLSDAICFMLKMMMPAMPKPIRSNLRSLKEIPSDRVHDADGQQAALVFVLFLVVVSHFVTYLSIAFSIGFVYYFIRS